MHTYFMTLTYCCKDKLNLKLIIFSVEMNAMGISYAAYTTVDLFK